MDLTSNEVNELVEEAKKARERSLAFRTAVKMGASVMSVDGRVYGGCNMDGINSGEGICGERMAIEHMVAHGRYHIRAICVFSDKKIYPCGICLQMMTMFVQIAGRDFPVVVADSQGEVELTSVQKLLPNGYQSQTNAEVLTEYKDLVD